MLKNTFLKENWDIITILIIYLLISFIIFRFVQYRIAGDEISYINIAHAYSLGHWENAINGYWSPLYSWLMALFIFIFGFKPVYGVYISKILSISIGFFTILAVRKLGITFNINANDLRVMLASLILPIVLYVSMYNTPDLLLVLLLLLYLSLIYNPEYSKNMSYGILCGFIGAMAYFTKSFAFPFFLVHFILFNIILYSKSMKLQKKTIMKNIFLGLTIFFVLSGLWIATISSKYDKLTFSTSGEYNQALVGPEYKVNTLDYGIAPEFYFGLTAPPNKDTTSIWGDPSYIKMDKWSPFDSPDSFRYEINLIIANIIYSFNIVESFMFGAIIVFFAMIFMIRSRKIDISTKNILKYLLITSLIYMGGYCLIIPEWRYLWFIFILLTISGFFIIDRLYRNELISNNIRNIFLIFMFCLIVFQPAFEVSQLGNQKYVYHDISSNLELNYNLNGNLASNNWDTTAAVAYYLNSKYYGGTKKTNNTTLINQELINNNIDYYFVWNNPQILLLNDYHEILNDTKNNLVVYKRNT